MNLKAEIAAEIVRRASKLDYKAVDDFVDGKPFILAGGALCGDLVNDYDLYPDASDPYEIDKVVAHALAHPEKATILARTKNALTVELGERKQTVQFCTYLKPSLEELVKSFDFAHIQVGQLFRGRMLAPFMGNVFFTDEFVLASAINSTAYTGSEYPLSSLIRLFKYHKRGRLTRIGAARAAMKILKDILDRGYENYRDYKDQLDAIDLNMPEMQEAFDLFQSLSQHGLVTHTKDDSVVAHLKDGAKREDG